MKSLYLLKIDKRVDKFIEKLDKKSSVRCMREIEKLIYNPIPKEKKHI